HLGADTTLAAAQAVCGWGRCVSAGVPCRIHAVYVREVRSPHRRGIAQRWIFGHLRRVRSGSATATGCECIRRRPGTPPHGALRRDPPSADERGPLGGRQAFFSSPWIRSPAHAEGGLYRPEGGTQEPGRVHTEHAARAKPL